MYSLIEEFFLIFSLETLQTSETDTQHLYNFGENLGVAFQLQDDILDIYGDPEKFGKQVGGDIISNKKTYLLIKALELGKGDVLEELNHWLSLKTFNSEEKVVVFISIYDRIGIKELHDIAMQAYADKALVEIGLNKVKVENKEVLMEFAELLVGRQH